MSKIVVLVGSKRKGGNTDLLVQSFVKGALQNNSVEIISVADYHVKPCNGCNACFTTTNNHCVQTDDMSKIYQSLLTADILVIASPLYFYGVSASLKAIIDRMHTPLRDKFPIKKLGLLLVGAAQLPELFTAIETQYQLVLNFFHLDSVGSVMVRGVKDKGDISSRGELNDAFQLGLAIT